MNLTDPELHIDWPIPLEDLDELERQVLADRRVINRASIKKKGPAELILSAQEDISVLLNGTDHIRIQAIRPGMDLSAALKDADQIDDYVDERFSYAFDEKYGYYSTTEEMVSLTDEARKEIACEKKQV